MIFKVILLLCVGYLFGSIPCGYIAGKFRKIDLQKEGFKKIGASNVYKTIGFLPAILVFFADFIKGIIPLFIGASLGIPENITVFGGLFAIIGHNWSIWLKFKGEGRGVATSTGLVYYLLTREVVYLLPLLIILSAIMKSTALPVFICFLLVPVLGWLLNENLWLIYSGGLIFVLLVIARLTGIFKVSKGKRRRAILSLLFFDSQACKIKNTGL